MHVARLDHAEPFTTKDGSTIRELIGPATTPAQHQSLAEATVPAGGSTTAHLHPRSEELYLFTAGTGRMRLAGEERAVAAGDCVVIPPGTEHKLWADPGADLVLWCCCAPAYAHDDTVLTEPEPGPA